MSNNSFQRKITVLLMQYDSRKLPWKAICPEHSLVAYGMSREQALSMLKATARAHLDGAVHVELTLLDLDEAGDE
jgi:hypothetical protein